MSTWETLKTKYTNLVNSGTLNESDEYLYRAALHFEMMIWADADEKLIERGIKLEKIDDIIVAPHLVKLDYSDAIMIINNDTTFHTLANVFAFVNRLCKIPNLSLICTSDTVVRKDVAYKMWICRFG